ncbi:glycosyltransferase family 2 protein [Fodinibius salsisoli]|uniref:Glycosyltransferase family 2 protein n=1 Tax=Fodinibius salsisoli TaxID=2820877 RepID=A0ABT3PLC8_9BACT|nr:glycosyltransferase family 2 protein [Fodinibius salsisoli]MCW9706758.1 glycosyltransferase family 2 protein [Fodinibius salsisoli]
MCESLKNEPFVSVLTPVYNGAEFLDECIQSVLNQTYSNWEYVIVNNQSTDNSLEIIEKYANQDDRIRVHNNKEFLPQMENLNHAFRQISSESKYCKVVHTDDWLFPECITKMVEVNEKYPSVGIVSSYRLDDRLVGLDGLEYPSNFNSGKEIARKYLTNGTSYFGSPSSILIRSDLIRQREKVYAESHLAADTGACVDLLKDSDFGFVHQVLTFTRRHDESMTNMYAKANNAFLHARLYSLLTYAPHFLNESEYEKSLSKEMKKYYILLARNLLKNRSTEKFKQQLEILDQLELDFEVIRFLKNLIRESALQISETVGIKLRRAQ